MKKFLTIAVLCTLWVMSGRAQDFGARRLAFWNVENFFDTQHDTLKADSAFTPMGDNHWTAQRYADKRNKIYKVVAAMQWPMVVGLAEVENDRVLRDLCRYTPLRRFDYDFVHYESPDIRGVDCALLYRKSLFEVTERRQIGVSDSAEEFFTRDILMVGGVVLESHDTCYLFVNHWPSKLGGAEADRHRLRIARLLLNTMDSVQHAHPDALVLAMGDFNAAPEEEAIAKGMEFDRKEQNGRGFYNLTHPTAKGTGSYKYQGSWSCIDQMIANRQLSVEVFAPDFLLTDDTRYMGKKPFRTYTAMRYHGGFSDHLPIIATIH